MFIRKYYSPEPTATLGTEETPPIDTSFTVTLPAGYTYAHFNLSGIAGGVAHDSSGNGNDGTVYNATWVGDGLYFNGRDAYVITQPISLNDAGTIHIILQPTNLSGNRMICDKGSNLVPRLYLYAISSSLKLGLGDSSVIDSGITLSSNVLESISLTFDQGAWTVYKSGEEVNNGTYSGTVTFDEEYKLGVSYSDDRFFEGIIVSFFIYNRALSEEEIQDIYYNNSIPRDGLVGEWTFDHGPSTQLNVTPLGQNSITPFYNITNTGDVNLTIRMNPVSYTHLTLPTKA